MMMMMMDVSKIVQTGSEIAIEKKSNKAEKIRRQKVSSRQSVGQMYERENKREGEQRERRRRRCWRTERSAFI